MTTPPGDDQQPYGQGGQPDPSFPPPGGYPYPPQPGYAYAPPDHPNATTSMVLGILGVVLCQVVAPFAWAMGKKTVAEIDASGGRLGGRGAAQAGYVLGIVGTALLVLALVFFVVYLVIVIAIIGGSAASA